MLDWLGDHDVGLVGVVYEAEVLVVPHLRDGGSHTALLLLTRVQVMGSQPHEITTPGE